MPTEQDILNLKLGKITPADFDLKFGAGSSQTYLAQQQDEVPAVSEKESRLTEIPEQLVGAGIDTIKSTIETIGGLSELVGLQNVEDFGATIREKALEKGINIPAYNVRLGKWVDAKDAIEYTQAKKPEERTEFGKATELVSAGIDEFKEKIGVDEPEYLHGALIKGVSQFLLGFVGGKKLLEGAGWATKKLTKEQTKKQLLKNTSSNLSKTMTASAIADFTVFDEHMPRLSDMANEFGWGNPLTEYLASDPDDSFAEGKLKNALEGFLIGLPLEGIFSSVRYLKLRKARAEGKKVDPKKIKQDEEALEKIEQELTENIDAVAKGETPKNIRIDKSVKVQDIDKKGLKEKLSDKNLGYGKDGLNTLIKNVEDYRAGNKDLDETLDVGINAKNLKDTPETHIIISDIVERLKKDNSGSYKDIETHAIVEKRAELLMQDPMKAMQSINQLAKQIDGASKYIVAGLSLAQSYANALPKIARLIQASKNPANGVATKWTEKDFDKVVDVLATLLLDEKIIERNVGRMLNAKNIKINKADVNVESVMREIELVRAYGGNKQRFMAKMALMDDARGVMRILRNVLSNKTWNVLNEVWINALLSSPSTHIINMTSNLIKGAVRPLEQIIGAKALKLVTRDKYYGNVSDEALDTYVGLTMFFNDAWKYTKLAWKNEQGILDGKVGKVEGVHRATDIFNIPIRGMKFGNYIRTATRALNAEDEFFKQINYRAKLYAIAVREARGLGKSMVKDKMFNGKAVSDFDLHVLKVFDDGFEDGIAKNPEALEWARNNTFTDELNPNSFGGKIQSYSNQMPAVKQIIPFTRTPLNIAIAVTDRTPIALIKPKFYKRLLSRNPRIQSQALGEFLLGNSLLGLATFMSWNGLITGGGFADPELRKEQIRAGWKPYSFKVGDAYIPFGRLDPYGMFFGLVGDYSEMWEHMEEKDRIRLAEANLMSLVGSMTMKTMTIGLAATVKNIASKTYLQGLHDFMDAVMSQEPWKVERAIKYKIGSYVPNIVTKFKFDPLYRETRSITEEIRSRLPYFSKNIEPRYNWLGEKDVRQGGFWSDFVFPMLPDKTKKDTLHEKIAELKQARRPLPEIVGGLDLTQYKTKDGKSAYMIWNELLAQTDLRKDLEELVTQKNWDTDYSDNLQFDEINKLKGSKSVEIQNIIDDYMADALDELKDMYFKSPKGNEINLGEELDKMSDNKGDYKGGALPKELEALL